MTDITTLRTLQATVRATDGPNRMLDRKLCVTLGVEPWINTNPDHIEFCMTGSKMDKATPALTASIDAVAALIEQVLPRWSWDLKYLAPGVAGPCFVAYAAKPGGEMYDTPETPKGALALLDAMLTALIAQAEAAP